MPGILSEVNKLAFAVAPVFWQLVYRSIAAMIAGLLAIVLFRLFSKYIPPNGKAGILLILICNILIFPYSWFRNTGGLSVMQYIEPVSNISYRYDYDVVQQQVHIAMRTDGDDMIDGLTDAQLMEKEQQVYYKSLVFDVVIPLVWLGGVAVGFGWIIMSAYYLRKKIKTCSVLADDRISAIYEDNRQLINMKKRSDIVYTDIVSVPAATGFFKNTILLPYYVQNMDDETVKYILLHEMWHIKRGDTYFNYFYLVLQTVYWFNPLIAVIMRYNRQANELVTDSLVVGKTNDEKAYAAALVQVMAHNVKLSPDCRMLCMTNTAENMKERIMSIKRAEFFRQNSGIITVILCVTVGVFSIFLAPTNSIRNTVATDFDTGIYYSAHIDRPAGWKQVIINIDGGDIYNTFPESEQTFGDEINIHCSLPANWTLTNDSGYETQSGLPVPLGEFSTTINIIDGEYLIGYVGVSGFEPYTEEIPSEIYYQTVWPMLRLGSFRSWDPFNSIVQTDSGESGTVGIWYVDDRDMDKYGAMAAAPHYTTNGVLAYDKDKQLYIGFGFVPSTVSDDTAALIAKSIVFEQ